MSALTEGEVAGCVPRSAPPARARDAAWEVLLAGVIAVATLAVTHCLQPRVTSNFGMGWDGTHYCLMAQQFVQDIGLRAESPYVYRIGVPYLVALVDGQSLLQGFYLVNTLANVITTVLLAAWLRGIVASRGWRLIAVALFALHWLGPLRFNRFYPALTDPWIYPFLLGGLMLLSRPSRGPIVPAALAALVFAGVFFREVILLLPVIALCPRQLDRRPRREELLRRLQLAIPALAAGLLALALIRGLVVAEGTYSFLRSARQWLVHKPVSAVAFGWLNTFGPLLLLPLLFPRRAWRFFRTRGELLALVACVGVLSWIGGSDIERFAFWAFPAVLAAAVHLLGEELRQHRLFAVVVLSMTLLLWRVLALTPQESIASCAVFGAPFLERMGPCVPLFDLFYLHGSALSRQRSIILHSVMTAVTVLTFAAALLRRRRSARLPTPPPSP